MTPKICKASRALTDLTQPDLAELANMSTQTVADFGGGARHPHPNNIKAIVDVFESNNIEYIIEK